MKNLMEISLHQNASTLGIVRPEFVSTTMDWWHLKSEAWGNSSIIHADLTHPNLIAAARGLSPFFLRIGGSFADIATYDMSNGTSTTPLVGETDRFTTACSHNPQLCLTRQRWDEVLKFANDTGAKIFFTLAYLQHTRDESGENDRRDWDSTNARQLLQYTAQSEYANTVFGFELGNEITHRGKIQNITRLVAAHQELRHIIDDETWSAATNDNYKHKPKILGPASVGPSETKKLVEALGPHIDIATYHKYHGAGKDTSIIKHAKGTSIIQHPRNFREISKAVNKYVNDPEVWVGEGAMAFNSGRQNITDSFVGSFWFTNMLGAISKSRPHTVYCRQAFVGGYYELISHETMEAMPDYWIAHLWKKLVNTKAIGPILSPHREDSPEKYTFGCCKGPGYDTVLIHTFCAKEATSNPIFIITNIDKKSPFSLNITVGSHITKYILTGKDGRRDSKSVILNGNQLLKIENGFLPELVGEDTDDLVITLPPVSIAFVIVRGFQVNECVSPIVSAAEETSQIKHSSLSSIVEQQPQVSSNEYVPFIASESEMHHPVTVHEVRQLALAQLLFAVVFFAFIFYARKRIRKSRNH